MKPIGRSFVIFGFLMAGLTTCGGASRIVGSGQEITQQRQLEPFDSIESTGPIEVDLKLGQPVSCKVSADDNIVHLVRTEVTEGVLRLYIDEESAPRRPIEIQLTAPTIGHLAFTGSGNASIAGRAVDPLELIVNGSGSVEVLHAELPSLKAKLTGSGSITAAGTASLLATTVTGSGDARLRELCASDASLTVSGSGSAELSVVGTLSAVVTGSGSIDYSGSPTVESVVTGSGHITSRGASSSCTAARFTASK